MRMLWLICGITLRNDISIVTIRDMTSVEKTEDFLTEHGFRLFGHVKGMNKERAPVKAKKFS